MSFEHFDADECDCTDGYLIGQGYGNVDVPDGWETVQACDVCGGALTDEEAAIRAAIAAGPAAYTYLDSGDDDVPGDWAFCTE